MTPAEFRHIALSFPDTSEKSHQDHPDFRAAGKIFATLGYPDKSSGMVKLTPVEQEMLVEAEPKVFAPCAGAWGRAGSTSVNLKLAKRLTLAKALKAAWELALAKQPSRKDPKRQSKRSSTTRTR